LSGYDWGEFEIYFYYPGAIDRVWKAWSTPAGLCSFLLDRCLATDADGEALGPHDTFEPGGTFHFYWRQEHELDGTYLEVDPHRRIAHTFGPMRVTVEFEETDAGTRVRLHQAGIGESDNERVGGHLNCRSCWVFFMTNLVSVLATGTDLRHKDPKRVSSMEVGFRPPEG